ncbi:sensor histidine kinase [Flammeovirga aprica]|uniref:7TM-DISM receptor extracellular domain-containing protein n=1 Tax=Flammeovirga aprica JL-4 TaxID=694437 RepID=A0A7X9P1I8_9BACT|nr:hypothetical protein [Flammeovirga aprica]NME67839.1 hypothetical protein [Flammeovirga aprica JL-4]
MKLYLPFFLVLISFCSCHTKNDESFTYEICNVCKFDEENLSNEVACQDTTFGDGDLYYFKVKLHSSIDQDLVLKINSVIVKSFKIWVVSDHQLLDKMQYGWEHKNIPKGITYSLGETIPIKANQEISVYCEIYDELWPVNQSVKVYPLQQFQEIYQLERSVKIICRSLIFLTILIGLLCVVVLKQRVFVVYVICAVLYVAYPETEYGSLVDYISLGIAPYNKYFLLIISNAYHYFALELYSYILFQRSNYLGTYGLILKKSVLPLIAIHLLFMVFGESQFVINLQQHLVDFAVLMVLLSDIGIMRLLYLGIKEKRRVVYYALGIFMITAMTVFVFSVLPNAHVVEKREVNRYIFHIIITFDMIAYLSLLFYQTYLVYKEKMALEKLQFEINQKYSSALIEGQEEERIQIRTKLEEEVNQKLDHIQQSENINNPSILSSISKTISKVRTISHYLVSPDFENETFYDVIEDLCHQKKYNLAKVHLSIPSVEMDMDLLIKNQIYRIIQALLDLSIEDNQKQTIHLSLLMEDHKINIYFENDLPLQLSNSKALQQLKNRVYTINGIIEINASELGTYIGIERIRI